MTIVNSPGGEHEVRLGMLVICTRPSTLSISGIGSCVGLAMREKKTFASGLAHIVLPASQDASDAIVNPGKYADTAVPTLIKGLLVNGGAVERIKAKLVGGARVLSNGGFDGSKNVENTRKQLAKRGVEVIAEDVGQTYGRSMRFDTGNDAIQVRRFQQRNGIAELKDIIVI